MPMRNIKITLAYNGSRYHGFQVQKNAITICEIFQNAVEKIFSMRYDVVGCSRTDSGVHANGYVLCMKITENIPCRGIKSALNHTLPNDIAVTDCTEVPLDFHPRYTAKKKQYIYRIWNSDNKNPFLYETTLHYPHKLDEKLLSLAAAEFVGTHDFTTFCALASDVDDKTRTIYSCEVRRTGDLVEVIICGDGFLYNMVRIIVGTLLKVAQGKFAPQDIPAMIQARDRQRAGATAPAHGLALDCVMYD